jgi:ABC-type multidrug transport system permease subunit
MAIEVPYMMVTVLVFCLILYPMVGFQFTLVKFLWFVLFMTLSFMYYTLYGMMCVALTPNIEIAGGLSFLVFMLWSVFSGFIISRKVNIRHLFLYYENSKFKFLSIMKHEKKNLTSFQKIESLVDQYLC